MRIADNEDASGPGHSPEANASAAPDPRDGLNPETILAAADAGVIPDPSELDVSDVAMTEALLDEIVQEQDPWTFIEALRERRLPAGERQRYYQPFIALVALKPLAEQDALLNNGQSFFHYRTDTARRDVEQLRAASASAVRIAPCAVSDELIAEIVHVPNTAPDIKYLVYQTATGAMEIADRVTVNSTIYMPPQSRLPSMGTLILPTDATEYGTDEELLAEIEAFIGRYLYLPNPRFRSIMAYYVMLTWVHDKFEVMPYLRFIGEPSTGKSTALDIVSALSFRTIRTTGATTSSPIFRLLERWRCTLALDEADFGKSDLWADMIKILNVGYRRGFAIMRSEKGVSSKTPEKWDVESFDVFGPKVMATRRSFEDLALESRCLTHTMLQSRVPPTYPLVLGPGFRAAAQALRNKLLLWRFRHYHGAVMDEYRRVEGLEPRLNQILLPMLACVNEAQQGIVIEHAREYQRSIARDRTESFEGLVARELLKRYGISRRDDRVQLKEVTEGLKLEYGQDMKVSPKRITAIVRRAFGLATTEVGGMTWVTLQPHDVEQLARVYGVSRETWDRQYAQSRARRTPVRDEPDAPVETAPLVAPALVGDNGADGAANGGSTRPRRVAVTD